jgi:hypothetical protein
MRGARAQTDPLRAHEAIPERREISLFACRPLARARGGKGSARSVRNDVLGRSGEGAACFRRNDAGLPGRNGRAPPTRGKARRYKNEGARTGMRRRSGNVPRCAVPIRWPRLRRRSISGPSKTGTSCCAPARDRENGVGGEAGRGDAYLLYIGLSGIIPA